MLLLQFVFVVVCWGCLHCCVLLIVAVSLLVNTVCWSLLLPVRFFFVACCRCLWLFACCLLLVVVLASCSVCFAVGCLRLRFVFVVDVSLLLLCVACCVRYVLLLL